MDPILASGSTATKAIEAVLEAGVPEENIMFVSLIVVPEGVNRICRKYQKVSGDASCAVDVV